MTTVVLDSANLVESLQTGVIPVPAGVAEDNAAQALKSGNKDAKIVAPPAPDAGAAAIKPEPDAAAQEPGEDEIEGPDGLTPKQKREFTAAMQKTIAKKHRMQKEAEEREQSEYNQRQLAERRADELAAEIAKIKAAQTPAPLEPKAPERKDFPDDAKYADALIDYRVDQKLAKQLAEQAKQREADRQAEVMRVAGERIDIARTLVEDYDEVVGSVETPVPAVVAGYMQESEMFAELGYHMARHPEVLEKISRMTAARQLVEIGKIESTLKPFASAKANGKEPSQPNGSTPSPETGSAPSKPRVIAPVIRPLGGGSVAQVAKDEGEMTSAEALAAYQKRHGVSLTARKRH